jgi:hypothetical protein
MPVHTHNGAERLEPEWVREAPQQLIAAVMMDNRFADNCAEAGHSVGKPFGNLSSMQRQIGGSSPLGHQSSASKTQHSIIPPQAGGIFSDVGCANQSG